MKSKVKSNLIEVVGCCEISKFPTYKHLVGVLNQGQEIICKSDLFIKDKSKLYAFIVYDKNNIDACNYSFIGKVEFLGPHPEYDYPFAYRFYPYNLVESEDICVDEDTLEPLDLYIKSKKL